MRNSFIIIFIIFSCSNVVRDTQLEKGKALFEDFSLSKNNTLACISCHPGGNTDRKNHEIGILNRTWDSQTLWNVKHTGPYMWDGEFPNLRSLIKNVVELVMESPKPISDEDLDALTAYVESLKSPVSPFRDTHGNLNELQKTGKAIFEDPNRGNCNKCHLGEYFTDGQQKLVGKDSLKINTPSLNGMWDTAPYWHNGRFKTIRELIDGHTWIVGPNDTINFTEKEKIALEAYLNAL